MVSSIRSSITISTIEKSSISISLGLSLSFPLSHVVGTIGIRVRTIGIGVPSIGTVSSIRSSITIGTIEKSGISISLGLSLSLPLSNVVGPIGIGVGTIGIGVSSIGTVSSIRSSISIGTIEKSSIPM